MARVYPAFETIKKFKQRPTEGELRLLEFLMENLDDDYEIFFNPYLNGDRPDVIVFRYGYGLLIFEVKDWNLSNYLIDKQSEHNVWIYKEARSKVKSPLEQVYKYKENLFELHVDGLLACKINDIRKMKAISCVVYFHKASEQEVNALCGDQFMDNPEFKYNMSLWGCDSLTSERLKALLYTRYISRRSQFELPDQVYRNIRRILEPSEHLKEQGRNIIYTSQQEKIIYSDVKEQRVSGVFGSGKTTVLVARAVQAYKRACKEKLREEVKILILTFNITLINYIKDRLNNVAEDFYSPAFIICNYHRFIKGELNNIGINISRPPETSSEEIEAWFEAEYYSNINLFNENQKRLARYDAILIDEIQDYKRPWMDILKLYFLRAGGEYVLFGDVKQNIYGIDIEERDVKTNVRSRPIRLNHSFRSDAKVSDLSYAFQKVAFIKKYELDTPEENTLAFISSDGLVNYQRLDAAYTVGGVYSLVRGIIEQEQVSPNDIVMLGVDNSWLCLFDAYYRYRSREKTLTTMETLEIRYRHALKLFDRAKWQLELYSEISRNKSLDQRREKFSYENEIMVDAAKLLSRLELYDLDPDQMNTVLEEICQDLRIDYSTFRDSYLPAYRSDIIGFREQLNKVDYEFLRRNKKLHFWANPGMIKISTIHSFKGWESHTIIMLVTPGTTEDVLDELLYVGITRAKTNLFIFNFGNVLFEERLKACRDRQGNPIISI
jgi:nuclease-related domain protein